MIRSTIARCTGPTSAPWIGIPACAHSKASASIPPSVSEQIWTPLSAIGTALATSRPSSSSAASLSGSVRTRRRTPPGSAISMPGAATYTPAAACTSGTACNRGELDCPFARAAGR